MLIVKHLVMVANVIVAMKVIYKKIINVLNVIQIAKNAQVQLILA